MNAAVTHNGYEIKIKEHILAYWQEWFSGWDIADLENGEVRLLKRNVDHAELHGILNKIRDLNLTLISVTQLSKEE